MKVGDGPVKMEHFDWAPVRRGDVYCSPACGGGCTYESWAQAVERAAALCAELGEGWSPHVWENLGWHYMAMSGFATIYGPQERAGLGTIYGPQERAGLGCREGKFMVTHGVRLFHTDTPERALAWVLAREMTR